MRLAKHADKNLSIFVPGQPFLMLKNNPGIVYYPWQALAFLITKAIIKYAV